MVDYNIPERFGHMATAVTILAKMHVSFSRNILSCRPFHHNWQKSCFYMLYVTNS